MISGCRDLQSIEIQACRKPGNLLEREVRPLPGDQGNRVPLTTPPGR